MTDREREAGSNRCRRRRRSRRRKRPAKLAPGAIAELFIAPVMVRADGVSRKMLAFEASLYSQVKRALVNRDVGAMAQIIALCERYGLLERTPEPPLRSGLYIIPKNWSEEEWRAMFKRHGPPPWPGPRSGLPGDPPKDSR
jgi:hypothetical protein